MGVVLRMRVEIWSDVVCPWCYLGKRRFERALDRNEAADVLASEDYGPAVETDEAMAETLGVTGVPFFVVDRRYAFSGAQPAEALSTLLDEVWAETTGTGQSF